MYRKILPIFSFQHITTEQLDKEILFNYRSLLNRYLNDRKLIPKDNLMEISYENFVKDPIGILEKTYDKLGIEGFKEAKPAFKKYVDKHKNYKPDTYKIDKSEKLKVYKEWKVAFEAFGYLK